MGTNLRGGRKEFNTVSIWIENNKRYRVFLENGSRFGFLHEFY